MKGGMYMIVPTKTPMQKATERKDKMKKSVKETVREVEGDFVNDKLQITKCTHETFGADNLDDDTCRLVG